MKSYVDIPVADKEKAIARLRLITQKEPPKVTWADGVCRPSDPSVAFHGWISDQRVYVTPIIPGYKNFSAPINGEFIQRGGQCVLHIKKPIELFGIKYGLLGMVILCFLLPILLFTEGRSFSRVWGLLFPGGWMMVAWSSMRHAEEIFFNEPLERIRSLCEQC